MTETRITNETTGGQKGQKPDRMSYLPIGPLLAVARHYAIGAEKYDDHNWRKGYDWSLSYDALQRHAMAFWSGEDIDEETGSPHMAAVVFHALALLEFAETHPELDNRYREPEPEAEVEAAKPFDDYINHIGKMRDAVMGRGFGKDFFAQGPHLHFGSGDFFFDVKPEPAKPTPAVSMEDLLEQIHELRREHQKPREVRMRQVDWDTLKLSVREHLSPHLYGGLESSSRLYGLPVIIDESVAIPTVFDREEPLVVDTNEIEPEIDQIVANAPKAAPMTRWGFSLGDRVEHGLLGEPALGTIVSLGGDMPTVLWDDEVPFIGGRKIMALVENLTVVAPEPKKSFTPGGILYALHESLNRADIFDGRDIDEESTAALAKQLHADGIIPVRNATELKTISGADRASVREILRAVADRGIDTTRPTWGGVVPDVFTFDNHTELVQLLDALEDAGLEITHIPTSPLAD